MHGACPYKKVKEAIMQQLKLFNLIKDYQSIKNMGMVMSVNSQNRCIYGNDYYIRIKNDILNHITMHELSEIVFNKFMGAYGGKIDIKPCTDCIYIHVDAWND